MLNIIEHTGLRSRPIGEGEFTRDMDSADRAGFPVHRWSGTDRNGGPLTVVWVAGRRARCLLSAYEITTEGRGE